MDFPFEANIVRTLAKIIDRGHLHRGFSLCTGVWIAVPRWPKRRSNIATNSLPLSMWHSPSLRAKAAAAILVVKAVSPLSWPSGRQRLDAAGQPGVALSATLEYVFVLAHEEVAGCWSPKRLPGVRSTLRLMALKSLVVRQVLTWRVYC